MAGGSMVSGMTYTKEVLRRDNIPITVVDKIIHTGPLLNPTIAFGQMCFSLDFKYIL